MKIIDINDTTREAKEVFPDPDYPGFMKIVFKNHHEWYSIREFLQKNPHLKHLTNNAPDLPEDLVGRVTKAGKTYIKDTDLNLQENSYLGFFVWISRGAGEGQVRTIIKNDRNKFTIDQAWDVPPDHTSQYVITSNEQKAKAMGNQLAEVEIEELEKQAFKKDLKRGRINKNLKYIKKLPTELD